MMRLFSKRMMSSSMRLGVGGYGRPCVDRFEQVIESTFRKIEQHPFNVELVKGELEEKKFRYFMQQDLHYLNEYGQVILSLAGKTRCSYKREAVRRWSEEMVNSERMTHHRYLQGDLGGVAEFGCQEYIRFLKESVRCEPFHVCLAAVVPCFWIYGKLGRSEGGLGGGERYQFWLNTYSSEYFRSRVERVLDLLEETAREVSSMERLEMEEYLLKAAELELQFFDSVYYPEKYCYAKASSNLPMERNF